MAEFIDLALASVKYRADRALALAEVTFVFSGANYWSFSSQSQRRNFGSSTV